MKLEEIKETIGGYKVKNLRYLPLDNIIVGLVYDPIYGKPNLHEGFISVQWSKLGKPIKLNKGRIELNLKIN
jgi:hypothetical protein